MIRFIGDVHGKFGRYKTLLADSPFPTIQVGDMGVGFRKWPHGEWSSNPPYDQMKAGGHRFIRGNHDNPEVCAMHSQWISDGTVEGDMMFIGGAVSIDRKYRVDGYSWWHDEELSSEKLFELADVYAMAQPKIMVTHECPELVAMIIVGRMSVGSEDGRQGRPMTRDMGFYKMNPEFASRTRIMFDKMLERHRPKLWIFGHWHTPFDSVINGTRFICLPELAHMDIDPEHLP